MSTTPTRKVTLSRVLCGDDFPEDGYLDGEWHVILDGQRIGVVRKGTAPKGTYNAWRACRMGFCTRTEAVAAVVSAFEARIAEQAAR